MTKEKNPLPYTPLRLSQRNELYQKLTALKTFRFIAYLGKVDNDTHVVRFYIPDLASPYLTDHQLYMDWFVTECIGGDTHSRPYLKGKSICGTLTAGELT